MTLLEHRATGLARLVAQVDTPAQMLDIVKTIPVGKGIAGETVAKNRPVTICNLQTDTSGVAKPGAKQTGVGGALCVPIRSGDKIIGTFGIGTRREHEFSAAETNALIDVANAVGKGVTVCFVFVPRGGKIGARAWHEPLLAIEHLRVDFPEVVAVIDLSHKIARRCCG